MSTSADQTGQPADLSVPIALAQLLEHLERRPRGAHPAQYQAVAMRLVETLSQFDRDTLEPLLRASTATAEIYENLHYAQAGLCRADLDSAMKAEIIAKADIAAAAQSPSSAPKH